MGSEERHLSPLIVPSRHLNWQIHVSWNEESCLALLLGGCVMVDFIYLHLLKDPGFPELQKAASFESCIEAAQTIAARKANIGWLLFRVPIVVETISSNFPLDFFI